jgi:hypothetical protein
VSRIPVVLGFDNNAVTTTAQSLSKHPCWCHPRDDGGGHTGGGKIRFREDVHQPDQIMNNRFSRVFISTVGGFRPWVWCTDEPVVSGNVYYESGRPL